MGYKDLRGLLSDLERRGQLVRITREVDPNQEITVIQHRVIAAGGPALLFERVKGSSHRVVTNLFGTPERVALVCGGPPAALGRRLARMAEQIMPPSLKGLWRMRSDLVGLAAMRMRRRSHGPVLECVAEPGDLNTLPVLTCWPGDGGPFFTLPLVHTVDPVNGQGNLGMYRLQRFDSTTTGMHWQIERGGGFHFYKAVQAGRPLPVSVILGGPPALTIAAVTPLPEGIDERLVAAYMNSRPLDMVWRPQSGHRVPANAEFVLEGEVRPDEMRLEGPFGDHFGHYSQAAEYPVFHVKRIISRKDAIFPATVVGKPVQEDYYIGEALQEIAVPLLRLMKPAVADIWAYPETGFHPLAVMAVHQRYPHEALKSVMGMLGEGQVSLTKTMIAVDAGVDVRNIEAVSRALWRYLSRDGLHLISPTAQDTLDFTGPVMNTGSRLIMLATRGPKGPLRNSPPPSPPAPADVHPGISDMAACGPAFLLVRVDDGLSRIEELADGLRRHPATRDYLFHVLVSRDIPLDDPILRLWGWFTRFDPARDIHPAARTIENNRLIFDFPIAIDARWKNGYPQPVAFDPAVADRVDRQWNEYGIKLKNR